MERSDTPVPKAGATTPPTSEEGASRQRWGHRWRFRLIWIGATSAVMVAVYLFRTPLLQSAAWGVIVPKTLERPGAVLMLGGPPCFDELQRLSRNGRLDRVLVIEWEPDRLVRTGLQPKGEFMARTELERRSLPPALVTVVPGRATSLWDAARQLRAWMRTHDDTEVLVLCTQFSSREQHRVFSLVLGHELAQRVHWLPVRAKRYDPSNWWKRKEGHVEFFGSCLGLLHVLFYGEGASTGKKWDTDEWVQVVTGQFSEVSNVGQL